MEFIAYFCLGAGTAVIAAYICFEIVRVIKWYRAERRFRSFIKQVADEGAKAVRNASREVSELTFRDSKGDIKTVKIVVDHALQQDHIPDKEIDFSGNSLKDLMMTNHKITEDVLGQVEEFVFSPKCIQDMKAHGMEPDEVVREMLRAAGRIP